MTKSLSDAERQEALRNLPLWIYDHQRRALYRRISFLNFVEAMAALVRIGFAAEKADHHPEWANVYNLLDIWLTTHDAGGVSERDFRLARDIDALVQNELK